MGRRRDQSRRTARSKTPPIKDLQFLERPTVFACSFLALIQTHTKKVASDALGNLTRDVGLGIEEGTVAALISRSLEGPGDIDADDDAIGSSYVAPGVSPSSIGRHREGGRSTEAGFVYQVNSSSKPMYDVVCSSTAPEGYL